MKRNLKALMIVLVVIMSVLCLCLAGCQKQATITFMSNGAVDQTQEVVFEKGSESTLVTLPSAPKMANSGYSFVGWYDNADFTGEAVTEATVIPEDALTFYAKWEKLYTVNLNLDGGSLASTSITGLKDGENVYDKVNSLVPNKLNAQFEGWYIGESKITSGLAINGADVTLTAKYKYAYTIEIYQQNLEGTAYEKGQPITGYENVGVLLSPEIPNIPGFVTADHPDAVTSKTISANATENVLKFYFDRKEITVTFQMDYPDESFGEDVVYQLVYGESITVPTDYVFNGYYLSGWENANGDVYYTNSINANLYNKQDGANATPDSFIPTEDMTLYPVWVKGYTDMFGGGDTIFVFDENSDVCYLSRGGFWFEGIYYAEDGSFEFRVSEDLTLWGVVNDTYEKIYYFSDKRAEIVAYEQIGNYLYTTSMINLDRENGITYKQTADTGVAKTSTGTYIIDDDGLYIANFTTGDLAGQQVVLTIYPVQLSNGIVNAFMFRDETVYNYGQLVQFVLHEGQLTYYTSAYFMMFDGFGTLYYFDGTQTATYPYQVNEDGTYSLLQQSIFGTSVAATIKVMELELGGEKVMGYMFYNSAFALNTFTAEDGTTISFDGCYEATLTAPDGTVTKGYYVSESSQRYTIMVRFFTESGVRLFALTQEALANGKYSNTFEEKLPTYAEYLYMNAEGLYYAPFIVLDDEVAGKANIYGYTTKKEYVKVSSGAYSYDKTTGLYTYVEETAYPYTPAVYETNEDGKEELVSDGVFNDQVDYSQLKSFVFAIDTEVTGYAVQYWYSYTDDYNVTTEYSEVYTNTNEEGKTATLEFVNGMVYFTNVNGVVFKGTVDSVDEDTGMMTIVVIVNGQQAGLYVELDEEAKTFYMYETAPHKAYELLADGTALTGIYLDFDGKGNATYVITKYDEENKPIEETIYNGTIKALDETSAIIGFDVYEFTGATEEGATITFKYITFSNGSYYFFAKYNNEINGTFTEKEGEDIIKLDGFGYALEYITGGEGGATVQGLYSIPTENVITLSLTNGTSTTTVYFDIDLATKTFTVRGFEYGTYLFIENGIFDGYFMEFDGYGKLTVYTNVLNEETQEYERVDIDTNGTYLANDENYTLTFKDGAKDITIQGLFGYYNANGSYYYAFYAYNKEVVATFINPDDWSMIVLDGYGFATRYDSEGAIETGTYTLISDNTFYYVNNAQTDACIYTYDIATGNAYQSNFTTRGYYTTDLDALQFSKYGYAIFGGTERLYYNVVNGDVTIYRYEPDSENANKFGYVEENFGRFAEVITYQNKKYYENTGYQLNFVRKEATKDNFVMFVSGQKYMIADMRFTPVGSEEFAVSVAIALVGYESEVAAVLVRERNEETNELETYLSYDIYRYDIKLSYTGDEATYEVLSMGFDIEATSYTWLSIRGYLPFFGLPEDDFMGTVSMKATYDVEGNIVTSSATTAFISNEATAMLVNGGMVDLNGDIVDAKDATFKQENGTFIINITGKDGYNYTLTLVLGVNGTYGVLYQVVAFTRSQTMYDDNYEINLERVVYTDYTDNYEIGGVYDLTLKKDGVVLERDMMLISSEEYIYVYREFAEITNRITKTVYYHITLTDKVVEESEGSEESEESEEQIIGVPLFETCSVVAEAVETIYDAIGVRFVDLCADSNEIILFCYSWTTEEGNVETAVYIASSNYYESADAYILVSGSAQLLVYIDTYEENGETVKESTIQQIIYFAYGDEEAKTGTFFNLETAAVVMIQYDGVYYRPAKAPVFDDLSGTYSFEDDGKFFIVELVYNEDGLISGANVYQVNYIYAEDGVNYIAIDVVSGDVIAVRYLNRLKLVISYTYDEATATYTLATKDGGYTVKVTEKEDGTKVAEISIAV